jgi:hypothetical protein
LFRKEQPMPIKCIVKRTQMFIPPTPPAYVCEQLFTVDKMKANAMAKVEGYFDRLPLRANQRQTVRLFVELRNPSLKKEFLERFELLILRRTMFKFIQDDIYIDIYESEAPILLTMPEVSDVIVVGPAK